MKLPDNFSLDGSNSNILCSSGSLKQALSDGVKKSKVKNRAIFDKKPWAVSG